MVGRFLSFFLSKATYNKEIQSLINGVHLIRPTLSPVARLFFEVNKTKEISRQKRFAVCGTKCGLIQVISLRRSNSSRSGSEGEYLEM